MSLPVQITNVSTWLDIVSEVIQSRCFTYIALCSLVGSSVAYMCVVFIHGRAFNFRSSPDILAAIHVMPIGLMFTLPAVVLGLSAIILTRFLFSSQIQRRRRSQNGCLQCGYGLVNNVCPECNSLPSRADYYARKFARDCCIMLVIHICSTIPCALCIEFVASWSDRHYEISAIDYFNRWGSTIPYRSLRNWPTVDSTLVFFGDGSVEILD